MRARSKRHWIVFLLTIVCSGVAAIQSHAEEMSVERGAYLVNVLAACTGCHTPKTESERGPLLSGGTRFGAEKDGVYAANITPDQETGIGNWSEQQIADAIRMGVKPDGTRINPPMPQVAYRSMTDSDVQSIVAYLRSVAPVNHLVPRADRSSSVTSAPDIQLPRVAEASGNAVRRGQYIANSLSHCTECHTPDTPSPASWSDHLNEGGRIFRTAKGSLVAPSITKDSLARYSDAELAAIITTGVRPDGTRIQGPMPVSSYAGMKQNDVDAIIAYLRR